MGVRRVDKPAPTESLASHDVFSRYLLGRWAEEFLLRSDVVGTRRMEVKVASIVYSGTKDIFMKDYIKHLSY